MTINLKVLGRNSYELVSAAGDSAQDHLAALGTAVTGILDGGSYSNPGPYQYSLSDLEAGNLSSLRFVSVVATEGTGSTTVYSNETYFKFNSSKILISINLGRGDWAFEFDYIRTSSVDWPVAATESINATSGFPHLTLCRDGTARVSVGVSSVSVKWGTVSVGVKHRYALTYVSGILNAYIDGVLQGTLTGTSPAVWGVWGAKSTQIALSSSNRIATTVSGSWNNARTEYPIPSGKTYWELELKAASSFMLGIADASMPTDTNFSSNAIGLYSGNRSWYGNIAGSTLGTVPSFPVSIDTVFMFAYDTIKRCLFVGVNGVWFNSANPAGSSTVGAALLSIPTGNWYPAVSLVHSAVILRASAEEFKYAPPNTFNALELFADNSKQAPSLPAEAYSSLGLGKVPQIVYNSAATASWDPTASYAGVTFSESNRRAGSASAWAGAKAFPLISSSAKVYWEIKINSGTNPMMGLATSLYSGSSFFQGNDGIGLYLANNTIYGSLPGASYTGLNISTASRVAGTIFMFAFDKTSGLLFLGMNGTWLGGASPSSGSAAGAFISGLSGTLYPAVSLYTGDSVTLQSKSSELSFSAPSGYTAAYEPLPNDPVFYSAGYIRNLRATAGPRYASQPYQVQTADFETFTNPEGDSSVEQVVAVASMNEAPGSSVFKAWIPSYHTVSIHNLDSGTFEDELLNWELHDVQASASSHCYRAASTDGTYKYVVLDVGVAPSSQWYLKTKVYESWNAVTHVGLNLAYRSDVDVDSVRTGSGLSLEVFASARWLALVGPTTTNGNAESLVGCFEIEKGDAEEPDGRYPRYAWLSQSGLYGYAIPPQEWNTLWGLQYYCFSLPRTVRGLTGELASRSQMTGTLSNRVTSGAQSNNFYCSPGPSNYGGSYYYSNYYIAVTLSPFIRRLEQMLPTGLNPWNTGASNYVFSAYAVDMNTSSSHIRGRFYGLKILANAAGQTGDTIAIRTDGTGLYSQTGQAVNHYVVRLPTGGCAAIPLSL